METFSLFAMPFCVISPAFHAKLLSRLYVTDYLNLESAEASAQYEMLKLRVPDTWLFPMPVGITADSKKQDDDLQAQFLNNQKDVLKRKYHNALEELRCM